LNFQEITKYIYDDPTGEEKKKKGGGGNARHAVWRIYG
jgi:hypothetical protein